MGEPLKRPAVVPLLVWVPAAQAHTPLSGDPQTQWATGLAALVLASLWLIYLRGAWRTWGPGTGGSSEGGQLKRLLWMHSGLALSVVAVFGPLDARAETSAALHMVQHMLFMVVIPPALVFARPLPQCKAGLGRLAIPLVTPLLRLTAYPMATAFLHAAMIWFWHVPRFYRLALDNPWWHAVEHACFLVSAGLFWWAVLRAGARRTPAALLALLFTLMHTGFLGAMLTFARAPLYRDSLDLADQQLAGLIMWVPGAVPYLLASAWLAYRWLQARRRIEQAPHRPGTRPMR